MKKSDFDNVLTLLSNPDTLADGVIELSKKLDDTEAEFIKLEASNNALKDSNSKMILSMSQKIPNVEPEKHEETDEEAFDRLFTSRFKEVNNE